MVSDGLRMSLFPEAFLRPWDALSHINYVRFHLSPIYNFSSLKHMNKHILYLYKLAYFMAGNSHGHGDLRFSPGNHLQIWAYFPLNHVCFQAGYPLLFVGLPMDQDVLSTPAL